MFLMYQNFRLVFGECEDDKKKKKEEEEKEKKQRWVCFHYFQRLVFANKLNVNGINIILCRYSSQFNPDLAKQNKLDPKRKYWLE